MALPADWSAWDQNRASSLDRELQNDVRAVGDIVSRIVRAKGKFIALNLSARWPTLTSDFVHSEKDASTRAEQSEISQLVDHLNAVVYNVGTSPLTNAAAAAIMAKYAV